MNKLKPRSPSKSCRSARGFSLVEVLVGVAISLIGILIMFQMVAISDQHSRTTASGGDAQVAGTLAMYGLERDIKPAGMGFGPAGMPSMGCNVVFNDVLTARLNVTFPMVPVRLTVGAAGAPDQIDVLSGSSAFFPSAETLYGATASTKSLKKRGGFQNGDLAIVAGNPTALPSSANCVMVEITSADDTDPNKTILLHTTANYTSFYNGPNTTVRYNVAAGAGAGFATGALYDMGPAPQRSTWQIAGGRFLRRTELIQAAAGPTTLDVAEGVINLKAQYGVDANADGQIADPGEWTTVAPVDWTRVLAIRVAVLVRSNQFEPTADPTSGVPAPVTPTAATPAWAGGTFVMRNVDGTPDTFSNTVSDPNNWRYYRYKVYEKVIPLRNMIWGTVP